MVLLNQYTKKKESILDKLKRLLHQTRQLLRNGWQNVRRLALRAAVHIRKAYRRVPLSNRIKISVLLVLGVLVLLIIALLCVPGSNEQVPEGVSLQSRFSGGGSLRPDALYSGQTSVSGGQSVSGGNGVSGASSALSSHPAPQRHTSDAISPSLSVPSIQTPAGGKAGHTPSASERTRWEWLMIYLEQCESFQFEDADKERKLAVGAARMAIELHDYEGVNDTYTEYWIDGESLQNYYYLLSGQYMRGGELDRLEWQLESYHYTQPTFVSHHVSARITSVYLLDSGFYRVEGIVTRGLPEEEGAYSRRISMILTQDPVISSSYYVLSLENLAIKYTPMEELESSSSAVSSGDVSGQSSSSVSGRSEVAESSTPASSDQPLAVDVSSAPAAGETEPSP